MRREDEGAECGGREGRIVVCRMMRRGGGGAQNEGVFVAVGLFPAIGVARVATFHRHDLLVVVSL
jgi:hypothetical protein